MKRRVIQIANSTQLISLPRKWSQKFNINKGDELEVREEGNSIIVETEKDISISKVEIDLKGKSKDLIHRVLSSLYRSGYDEIRIMFENLLELEAIQSTVNQELIGFEIIEEGKDYIIVKQISNIEHSEFEPMLRRSFIFLLNTADEILDALKSNDIDILKNLVLRDITINKLTDYCRRSINKKESYFKRIGPGYAIIELLEKISDDYRDLCKFVSENRVRVNKSIIVALSEINSLLRDLYKLFYNFSLGDMENFLTKKKKIDDLIFKLSKNIKKGEVVLLFYLDGITNKVFYLNGPLMINGL